MYKRLFVPDRIDGTSNPDNCGNLCRCDPSNCPVDVVSCVQADCQVVVRTLGFGMHENGTDLIWENIFAADSCDGSITVRGVVMSAGICERWSWG